MLKFMPEEEGLPSDIDEGEYKGFVRRLPEIQFWALTNRAFFIGFTLTFFSFFDIPVFWPILL